MLSPTIWQYACVPTTDLSLYNDGKCFADQIPLQDNANLLDIKKMFKVGRFLHYIVGKSAVFR